MNPNASIFDPTYIDYYHPEYGYMGPYEEHDVDTMNQGGYFHVNTFSEPNQPLELVSALSFDKSEEILWTGTSNGRIISYLSPDMIKYTSWRAFYDEVKQISGDNSGVIALSSNSIRHYTRCGLLLLSYSNQEISGLQCFMRESGRRSSLIIGSLNDSMYIFDMNHCKIIKEISVSSGVTCMTKTLQKICSGHTNGTVTLKDHRTHRDIQSFKAHSHAVSSIDARSHLIVTCGYTQRNGRLYNDNMAKVYDIRMNRILDVINYKGAKFVKFHPSYTSVAFLVNHRGQFKLTDISTNMIDEFYDSGINEVYSFNISSTGNVLGFTDSLGYIHIWTDREDMPINSYSHNNIEFMDEVNPPMLSEWSSFTLPSFYQNWKSSRIRKTLLSDWDNDSFFATTKQSEPIDPKLIENVRYDGYVGIIPNVPGTMKRNQTKRYDYNQLTNEKYVISKNERQTEVIKFEPKKLVPMNFKKLLQVVDEKKQFLKTSESRHVC